MAGLGEAWLDCPPPPWIGHCTGFEFTTLCENVASFLMLVLQKTAVENGQLTHLRFIFCYLATRTKTKSYRSCFFFLQLI